MSELIRMVGAIASMSYDDRCWKCGVSPVVHSFIHYGSGA